MIEALEAKLGLGRDDYPVIPMWNAIIAGVVFQHESIELLLRELSRNPSLLHASGFNVLPLQKKPVEQLVKNELTGRMDVVWPQPKAPHYAVPNSWNFSRFLSNLIVVETEQGLLSQMLSTFNAKTGNTWKKVKNWFGYGLHLIADTHYEIPVAFHLTPRLSF